MNRRSFLRNSALATGLVAFPHIRTVSAQDLRADKINVAFVGVGGHGKWTVRGNQQENTVGFCDVDDKRAADTYSRFPDVPRFRDFRKLFDKLGKGIDAVNIATPDHTHFPIAMEALQRGYHVYLEKPMAHSIYEIRALTKAAKQYDRVTQLGIQGHSANGLRVLKEWLDAGVIGDVLDVHFWTDRPLDRDYHTYESDAPEEPVPDTLDWDLWLGPARYRPYNSAYLPTTWRGWWDFGNGPLGDIGAHMWDVAEYCLQLGAPKTVTGVNPRPSDVGTPKWAKVDYLYEGNSNRPPVVVHWYNGTRNDKLHVPEPLPYLPQERLLANDSCMYFLGEKGGIFYPDMRARESPTLSPESLRDEFRQNMPPQRLPRMKGSHHTEFFNAIREGRKANADFAYGGPLNEGVLVGNLALRTGKTIHWNAEKMSATGVPEADRYIYPPEPRPGWKYD